MPPCFGSAACATPEIANKHSAAAAEAITPRMLPSLEGSRPRFAGIFGRSIVEDDIHGGRVRQPGKASVASAIRRTRRGRTTRPSDTVSLDAFMSSQCGDTVAVVARVGQTIRELLSPQ